MKKSERKEDGNYKQNVSNKNASFEKQKAFEKDDFGYFVADDCCFCAGIRYPDGFGEGRVCFYEQ